MTIELDIDYIQFANLTDEQLYNMACKAINDSDDVSLSYICDKNTQQVHKYLEYAESIHKDDMVNYLCLHIDAI